MNSIWKPVIGYEGHYEYSANGDVRSLDRITHYIRDGRTCSLKSFGKLLKPTFCKSTGYLYVDLCKDGIRERKNIHRIVAESEFGVPETAMDVNHKDGNKLNNSVDNLEWVTRKENIQHAWTCGLATCHITPEAIQKGRAASLLVCRKAVMCCNDGRRFNSRKEAAEYYSVSEFTVYSSIKHNKPSSRLGLMFKDI